MRILEKEYLKRVATIIAMVLLVATILSLTVGRAILEGRQPGLTSFALLHFAGYLFFIIMPVEALIPFYLAEGHSAFILIFIAVGTAITAHVLDYAVGSLFSDDIINKLIGKWRYQKAKNTIEKYGDWAIFVFSMLPISSPILMLAAGMVRLKLLRALTFSVSGLLIKYTAIVLIFGLI